MLDVAIPDFIDDWRKTGLLKKWVGLLASCLIGGFVGFWGTLGLAGSALLAAGHSPAYALMSAFFLACLMMAAVVFLSVQKSGLVKSLSIVLPKELETVLETTDIGKLPSAGAGKG